MLPSGGCTTLLFTVASCLGAAWDPVPPQSHLQRVWEHKDATRNKTAHSPSDSRDGRRDLGAPMVEIADFSG